MLRVSPSRPACLCPDLCEAALAAGPHTAPRLRALACSADLWLLCRRKKPFVGGRRGRASFVTGGRKRPSLRTWRGSGVIFHVYTERRRRCLLVLVTRLWASVPGAGRGRRPRGTRCARRAAPQCQLVLSDGRFVTHGLRTDRDRRWGGRFGDGGPAQRFEARRPPNSVHPRVGVADRLLDPTGSGAHVAQEDVRRRVGKLLGSGVESYVPKVGFGGKKAKDGARPGAPRWARHVSLRRPRVGTGHCRVASAARPSPSAWSRAWPGTVPRSGAGVLPSQPRFPWEVRRAIRPPAGSEALRDAPALPTGPSAPGPRALARRARTTRRRREGKSRASRRPQSAPGPSSPACWPFCRNRPEFCLGEARGLSGSSARAWSACFPESRSSPGDPFQREPRRQGGWGPQYRGHRGRELTG